MNLEPNPQTARVAVTRKAHFCAAHRLNNPGFTNQQNQQIFGKCNYPNYHGHNYNLLVKVTGPVQPDTGYVIDMKQLAQLIDEKVVNKFDHRNLNIEIEEFKTLNPTAENISIVIYSLLRPHIDAKCDLKITLYETERNIAEYPA